MPRTMSCGGAPFAPGVGIGTMPHLTCAIADMALAGLRRISSASFCASSCAFEQSAVEGFKLGPNLKPSTADCSNAQEEAQKLAEEIRRNPANAMSAMAQVKCGIVPMPTPGANGAPPQLMVRGMGQPISNLVSLVTQFTGRQVVDKTGLTGNYDFELELPLDMEILRRVAGQAGVNLPAGPQQNLPAYDGPAMTTIISERLGLKLD